VNTVPAGHKQFDIRQTEGVLLKLQQSAALTPRPASRLEALVRRWNKEGYWQLYILLIPVLVHIFIFNYIPMYGLFIAFQDYGPGRPFFALNDRVVWVGLKHFRAFIENPYFWRLIKNTLVLSGLNLVFGFWVPIFFALILNEVRNLHYKKFVQTASYLPYFISSVVVAGMVLSFINSDGIFNSLRGLMGLEPIAFDIDPKYFPAIYTVTNVWKSFGWNSILYLSNMSSIDTALYEAARLDGAGRIKQMWYVTLPMLKNLIMLQLIFAVGGVLSANSEMILLLYNPATYETADVIGTYVYRDSLLGGRYSYGTAVGLFTSVINFGLMYIANTISRKVCDYSLW